MNSSFLVFLLFITAHSFAATSNIICLANPDARVGSGQGQFLVNLDNSTIRQGAGVSHLVRADWSYMYSAAQSMNCSKYIINLKGAENFKCIGYTNGEWGMEINIKLNNGEGFAKVRNLNDNIYARITEGLRLTCSLEATEKI
jgi:hypothetical protein